MIVSVVEDERQLDGSRHVEIVGERPGADAALRLVIGRSGDLEEAELSLEIDGDFAVIGFEGRTRDESVEALDIDLESDLGRASLRQRDDGDLDFALVLERSPEADE